jgi:Malectin domain
MYRIPNSHGSSNNRLFNVAVEGTRIVSNLDVFATVGKFTAYTRTTTVNVTDGFLTIALSTVKDNAQVSAIEILPRSTISEGAPTKRPTFAPSKALTRKPTKAPSKAPTKAPTRAPAKAPTRAPTKVPTRAPTKVPTRAPTKAPTRAPTKIPTKATTTTPVKPPTKPPVGLPSILINSGSGEGYVDPLGRTWSKDQYFAGGLVYCAPNNSAIGNTELDGLYHCERYGSYSYSIPVVAGSYAVTLHFAEL